MTPVLFVSHGAPTFALAPGQLGPLLTACGEALPPLRAVVVLSPHWQTPQVRVMSQATPVTVHDFGGFPAPLYQLQYPAPGAPDVAAEVLALLQAAGITADSDDQRGRDHGAWVPLLHLLPQADVPVLQLSMPRDLTAEGAWQLGRALAPLRQRGVLLLGSGSLTHNLYEVRFNAEGCAAYAEHFRHWVADTLARRDSAALLAYRQQAPAATRAHPTEEHFLPLLFAAGASRADDQLTRLDGGIEHGVLAMDSYLWHAAAD
ncbi:MAG: DODA-type extradiol aromatic ring-opening family dioxygenase [Permianibacter sp.]